MCHLSNKFDQPIIYHTQIVIADITHCKAEHEQVFGFTVINNNKYKVKFDFQTRLWMIVKFVKHITIK